jgi:WD40 repeat protein
MIAAQPTEVSDRTDVQAFAWQPTAERLTFGLSDGQVLLQPVTDQQIIPLTKHLFPITVVEWSDDGILLASADIGGVIHISDLRSGETHILETLPNSTSPSRLIRSMAWSSDRMLLAVGNEYGRVAIYDANTKEVVAEFLINTLFNTNSTVPVTSLIWNSDNTQLYIATVYNALVIWNRFDGQLSKGLEDLLPSGSSGYTALGYFPATNTLLAGAFQETLVRWNLEVGKTEVQGSHHADPLNFIQTIETRPYTNEILTVSRNGEMRLWNDIYSNGSPSLLAEIVTQSVWSPFGGRIAYIQENSSNDPHPIFRILIPDPSLEQLNAIADLCFEGVPTPTIAPADQDTLPSFVAEIEALPEEAIPTSCRADLLAVADALIQAR